MRICLYAFSGTGNTVLYEEALAKEFREKGHTVDLFLFKAPNDKVPSPLDYDMIGIGYPIHAFNVPLPFTKFVRSLPSTKKPIPYFIFKVSGEPFGVNASSSHQISHILRHKGYCFKAERHFLLPYNIMFRYPLALEKEMYLYIASGATLLALEALDEKRRKPHYPLYATIVSVLLRIEWIAGPVNRHFVHLRKGQCVHCGLCASSCPTGSLSFDKKGKIRIKSSCSICMKCTFYCPKNAIVFGFLSPWAINGSFGYEALKKNESLDPDFVNDKTKGYFRYFRKYYAQLENDLKANNIDSPIIK